MPFGISWYFDCPSTCFLHCSASSLKGLDKTAGYRQLNFYLHILSPFWPYDFDCLEIAFPSVERMEFSSLSSLTDWISACNCVERGVTIAFIFLFISLEVILRSNSCDRRFFFPALPNSHEWWASPSSTNCLVWVWFSSDKVTFATANS